MNFCLKLSEMTFILFPVKKTHAPNEVLQVVPLHNGKSFFSNFRCHPPKSCHMATRYYIKNNSDYLYNI